MRDKKERIGVREECIEGRCMKKEGNEVERKKERMYERKEKENRWQ